MKKKKRKPEAKDTHHTRRIVLKTADVDEEMVPLVKWLNTFPSVCTLFCCQGELRDGREEVPAVDRPYLSFLCLDAVELIHVLRGFNSYCNTEVEWSPSKAVLLYRAEWSSRDELLENIRYLRDTRVILD